MVQSRMKVSEGMYNGAGYAGGAGIAAFIIARGFERLRVVLEPRLSNCVEQIMASDNLTALCQFANEFGMITNGFNAMLADASDNIMKVPYPAFGVCLTAAAVSGIFKILEDKTIRPGVDA
jgi:hypothetical protein